MTMADQAPMPDSRSEAPIAEPLLGELKALIDRGKRIDAIKRYRVVTGSDLATSHTVVNRLAAVNQPGATAPALGAALVPLADKIVGLVGLLALFFWACGVLAGAAAAWQAYDRYIIRTTRPQIEADVADCRILHHHPRRGTSFHTLGCTFRYEVEGREYSSEIHSTGVATFKQMAAMEHWVAEHRRNPKQRIHYDPADPQHTSLGDADASFQADTVEHRLQLAGIFTIAGAVAFAFSRFLAARQRLRAASRSSDQS